MFYSTNKKIFHNKLRELYEKVKRDIREHEKSNLKKGTYQKQFLRGKTR